MALNTTDALAALRQAFPQRPPETIKQEAFDASPKQLKRLARLRPGERAEVEDLWAYTQSLLYTEIQGPLLEYLLPFCLEAWREDLRGTRTDLGGFVEQLYPAMAYKRVLYEYLTPPQRAAASGFMRASILEEIDDQRDLRFEGKQARPYRWIGALTTHGVLSEDIELLWNDWWSLGTVGRAVAAVQYISCLMYPANENPVFAPWTPDGGGGPACLWEYAGAIYNRSLLEVNIAFLTSVLNPQRVKEVLTRAVERLAGEPGHEIAAGIQPDFELCRETVTARCAELPKILALSSDADRPLEWAE
jgi:hypothetical protein